MKHDCKFVNIYIDSLGNLIIIPLGLSKQRQLREIDLVSELAFPYSDEQLMTMLLKCIDQCYKIVPEDDSNETILEKFLGIKGYAKVTKERKLIVLNWYNNEGYSLTPTQRKKGGFYNEIKSISLGRKLEKSVLFTEFQKTLEISN